MVKRSARREMAAYHIFGFLVLFSLGFLAQASSSESLARGKIETQIY